MKKALALLMAATITATAFAGCGDKKEKKEATDGGKAVVQDYIDGCTSKDGAKKYYTATFLGSTIKQLKKDDDWDDMIDDWNDSMEDTLEDYKFKVKSIEKTDKLDDDALEAAENYFQQQADRYDVDDDIKVKGGAEYKIKIQVTEDDGDKETNTQKLCAVEVKGDGWKVITLEAEDLVDYYGD